MFSLIFGNDDSLIVINLTNGVLYTRFSSEDGQRYVEIIIPKSKGRGQIILASPQWEQLWTQLWSIVKAKMKGILEEDFIDEFFSTK